MFSPRFENYAEPLAIVRQLIQVELERWRSPYTEFFYDQGVSFLSRPAKLLRPFLVVLICDRFEGDLNKACACGAAVELYHNATLIYDDIQDNSPMRRGRPSIHISTNLSVAMSLGGWIRTLMYHPILHCSALDMVERAHIHGILDTVCTRVTIGQGIEALWGYQDRWDIQEEEYLEMIQGKTGALFAACTELGAYSAGAGSSTIAALRDFGTAFGSLFQLKNDYLDLFGIANAAGRPLYDDLREGKRTIFVIRAIKSLTNAGEVQTAERFKELLKSGALNDNQLRWCLDVLISTQSVESVRQEMEIRAVALANQARELPVPAELTADFATLVDYLAG